MIPVVVIADDYGISPAVSAAIRDLLREGRLSGTSAMATSPFWEAEGAALGGTPAGLGLHLVLTDQVPLGPMPRLAPRGHLPSFAALSRAAVAGRLDVEELRAELQRQVDRFVMVVGRAPEHLDGHHHVHQLPIVGPLVIELARQHRAWVRTCWERPATILRRAESVGRAGAFAAAAFGLHRRLRATGIRTNDGFAGAYGFGDDRPYGERFTRFLVGARPGTVIMCHPGRVDAALRQADSLTEGREQELAFLASDDLEGVLRRAGCRVVPMGDVGGR